jgi:hypothetical protein
VLSLEGGALLRALFLYSAACTSMIEVIGHVRNVSHANDIC